MKLSALTDSVAGDAACRRRQRLQPVGGPGDKVFPPTHPGKNQGEPPVHVTEQRRVFNADGTLRDAAVDCVLIDSVQSQANRLEEALLLAVREEGLALPYLTVRFEGTEAAEVGEITSLEAPHRIYDAILRDSLDGDVPFMDGELGQALKTSTPKNASAVLEACPTALLFGAWHSQGSGGGVGSKFPRCIVSEIVGIDSVTGKRTGSRMDPIGASKDVPLFQSPDKSTWSDDKAEIGKGAKQIKASAVNHGNIPPTMDELGVTFAYAEQVAVVTFAGLRRLRFGSTERDRSAWAYLAALGLYALVARDRAGYALRSRCDLVPDGAAPLELVRADGSSETIKLSIDKARALYDEALAAARSVGFAFKEEPHVLVPQQKLVNLVVKSRDRALRGLASDED